MAANDSSLRWFLKFGYFPEQSDDRYRVNLQVIDRSAWAGANREWLIEEAAARLRAAVSADFQPSTRHVVPLSGGLDSRALLAVLLEHSDAQDLYTYTYGVPGSFDYEYGNAIARKVGTRHTSINLDVSKVLADEETEVARRTGEQCVLFHHAPLTALDELCSNAVVWSGFVGDAICGGHMPADTMEDPVVAQSRYLSQRPFVMSCDISGLDNCSAMAALAPPRVPAAILSFHEQLLYEERVAKMICPQIMWHGYTYRTPFINNSFMELMLGIEDKHRRSQSLYRAMLVSEFPEMFEYPTTANFGLSLGAGKVKQLARRLLSRVQRGLNRITPLVRIPYLNYRNFAWAMRQDSDFSTLIRRSVTDLELRGAVPWVDIGRIWQRHQSRRANHADALLVLASLELILKAGES